MRFSIALAILLLAACRSEDPRIAEAEATTEAICDCTYLQCAFDVTESQGDERGLEQEDYANLSDDLIARYTSAMERRETCIRRLVLE